MEDKLAKRLGYPRPLEDGGFAVMSGFSTSWSRLDAGEFDRFVDNFIQSRWIGPLTITFATVWLLCLFFFTYDWANPALYFMIASALIATADQYFREKRFRGAFPEAHKVKVLDSQWIWSGLAGSEPLILGIGPGCLLLGWALQDIFPDSLMQRELAFGLPAYVFLGGLGLMFWVYFQSVRLYYRATRGCRLTYDNLIKTEGPASFTDVS